MGLAKLIECLRTNNKSTNCEILWLISTYIYSFFNKFDFLYHNFSDNCIHYPLFFGSDDSYILEIAPPPALHLLIGCVNHLFTHLEKSHPDVAMEWATSLYIQKEGQNNSFNGNSSRKLLKNYRFLLNYELLDFYEGFMALDSIVEACFGADLNDSAYRINLKKLYTALTNLKVSITPKFHIVLTHIGDFIDLKNESLGQYNEQSFEAVHSTFKPIWGRFKVKQVNQNYKLRLKRAVSIFNMQNI